MSPSYLLVAGSLNLMKLNDVNGVSSQKNRAKQLLTAVPLKVVIAALKLVNVNS